MGSLERSCRKMARSSSAENGPDFLGLASSPVEGGEVGGVCNLTRLIGLVLAVCGVRLGPEVDLAAGDGDEGVGREG